MPDKTSLITRALQGRIEAGTYAAATAIPSERRLMAEFGVSRTTIRRALAALSRSGVLFSRAGSGTFVGTAVRAGAVPAGVLGAASGALVLSIPTFSDPYYGEIIECLEREARRFALKIIVTQSNYSADDETRQLEGSASDPIVRGAIVVPSTIAAPSSGALTFVASGKPLVYLGRWPAGIAADGVRTDYREAALLATRHLLDRGDCRIAYIEGHPHLPGFTPFDGYREALRGAGLEVERDLVRILDLASEAAGVRGVAGLIADRVPFTAVLARNDVTAMGVLRGLASAGLQVPRDVAVASIDNSLLARSVDPPLTSANPFPDFLGRTAVRLLHDRIEGLSSGAALHVTVGTTLIARRSTEREPHRAAARRAEVAA
jgi:DNA-binding LacI/PurR family transcriptional regulator